MLRITTAHLNHHIVLHLEGRLAGEAVETMRQEILRWQQQPCLLMLDFEGVRFIDEAGMTLLQGWQNSNLQLRGGSDFIRACLKECGLRLEKGG